MLGKVTFFAGVFFFLWKGIVNQRIGGWLHRSSINAVDLIISSCSRLPSSSRSASSFLGQ